jgi:hypothetical protein
MNISTRNDIAEKTTVLIRSTATVVLSFLVIFLFPLLLLINPLYNYQITGSISLDAIISWVNMREALILTILLGAFIIPIVCIGKRQSGKSS